jgi:hypothetical protein
LPSYKVLYKLIIIFIILLILQTGAITDVVYGVEGGMEDWAYAAGWEN